MDRFASHIRPGSTVLEFGCANGQMTRFFKEELGCDVYIVEIDEGAYQEARQYARDGVCGDAEALKWREQFSGVDGNVWEPGVYGWKEVC